MAAANTWNRRELFSRLGTAPRTPPQSQSPRPECIIARRAMACEFSVTLPPGRRDSVAAGCAALDEIDRLEERLSAYRDSSDVSYLNRHAASNPTPVDAGLFQLLRGAGELHRSTAGAFDCATGALIRAWGFFRGPRRVPPGGEHAAALAASGWRHVQLDEQARTVHLRHPRVELNLGAIGKGYAIDRAAVVLVRDYGVRSALVQGGQSSLLAIGAPPEDGRGWKVGIPHPGRPGRRLAIVHLRNRALGTSGDDNQFFTVEGRRYGHILDPRTGYPAAGLISASVTAPTAAEADALSTAFFVMGIEPAVQYCRQHPGIAAILIAPGETDQAPRVTTAGTIDMEVFA